FIILQLYALIQHIFFFFLFSKNREFVCAMPLRCGKFVQASYWTCRCTGGLEDSYDLAGRRGSGALYLLGDDYKLQLVWLDRGLTLLNGRTSWTARRYAYQPFDSRPCNVAYFTRTHVHVYSRNAPEC